MTQGIECNCPGRGVSGAAHWVTCPQAAVLPLTGRTVAQDLVATMGIVAQQQTALTRRLAALEGASVKAVASLEDEGTATLAVISGLRRQIDRQRALRRWNLVACASVSFFITFLTLIMFGAL